MAFTDAQAGGRVLEFSLKTKVTLAGTVSRGDIIGYSSGWKRALATAGSVVHGMLVALDDGVSGEVIEAARGAVIDGRFSEGTPGAVLYVAEGTDSGEYTETLPTTQNDVTTPVGFMITATMAMIWPESGARTLDPS